MSATATATFTATSNDTFPATIVYQIAPADGARAYFKVNTDPKKGGFDKNSQSDEHEVQIENVREKKDQYTLDNAGFQFSHRPTKVTNFQDDKELEEVYYPESIELIKELTGASRVVIFDHSQFLHILLPLCQN